MSHTGHDDFDRRMRAVHAHAVDRLPSRITWQLAVRRDAAARAPARPAHRAGAWWLATACAAVFALAVGLRQPDPAPAPALPEAGTPTLAAATIAVDAAAYGDGIAALEEDPDLYLWLAAQDSLTLAME